MMSGLSNLRILIVLLVVLGHSSIPYVSIVLPGLHWAVQETTTSLFITYLACILREVTIPVLFVLAGFSSGKQLKSLGNQKYFFSRVVYIFLPFFIMGFYILPIIYYVWSFGWVVSGKFSFMEVLSVRLDQETYQNFYGPCHLWFLQYLFISSIALLIIKHRFFSFLIESIKRAFDIFHSGNLFFGIVSPILLSFPILFIHLADSTMSTTFYNSYIPKFYWLIYYLTFFLFGIWLFTLRQNLSRLARFFWPYFIFSIILGFLAIPNLIQFPGAQKVDFILGVELSLFKSYCVYAALAFGLKFLSRKGRSLDLLRKSSYWIYICHVPIVGLFQSMIYPFNLHPLLKLILVFALSAPMTYFLYVYWIRHTFVDVLLGNHHLSRRNAKKYYTVILQKSIWMVFVGIIILLLLGSIHLYFYLSGYP